jgi:surface carbohydrate biosynthesis protein
MRLFGKLIRFGDPKLADIVIFDECQSHNVQKVLDRKYSVTIFNQRPYDIWIGLGVIFYFFRFLGHINLGEVINHRRAPLVGIFQQFKFIYFKSCLAKIKPRAVVTFIDNSLSFSWLSKNCRSFPLIAIQNGSRLSYAADNNRGYYLQHLFCFGSHEINLFPSLGYRVEKFYPVGSLVASLHFNQQTKCADEEFDLLIVSTWRGNIGFEGEVSDTMRSMKIMDYLLASYIKSSGVRAAVILRAERDSEHWYMPELGLDEESYYQEIYGDLITVFETDLFKRNIFPIMQQSKLIISCLSSALLEAYGIGKKVLYCNFTGTNLYHQDFEASIVISDRSYESFSEKIDEVLKMPQLEYWNLNRERMKYYMSNPKNCLSYQAISEKIDQIIENS